MAEAISAARSSPVGARTKAVRAASQSSLKLCTWAETQICRTGELGLTTNRSRGSSNSIDERAGVHVDVEVVFAGSRGEAGIELFEGLFRVNLKFLVFHHISVALIMMIVGAAGAGL